MLCYCFFLPKIQNCLKWKDVVIVLDLFYKIQVSSQLLQSKALYMTAGVVMNKMHISCKEMSLHKI